MLGNDVVDLNLAKIQSNWRRKNYLDKIFTGEEQKLISLAENPDVTVWLLWSMKEAAYKIHNRTTNKRLFNPISFQCQILELNNKTAKGFVKYDTLKFLTASEISSDFIHTIATDNSLFFKNLNEWQNPYHSNYLSLFNSQTSGYQIYYNESGLPEIKNTHGKTIHDTSVSHHGNYVRIVFNS
ncbi:4'-phosphopantetheinyl transferase family protein [Pedobacter rhodius]|uniref:4'-phosphopantetheinyl transferase superfamily protein n=1 Tax=Pedobacter rhodius TaxID=3004098 RepID=A0ABT4L461_9SPHI|nr:4'-phosphopantetheinyl transferase superfamily protein [Pedobacter sp. SJ11]MCZ4225197.1 4'-phosphopantetheinyl transferase superfamily protein [Pedobacter sp. SJ11]